MVESLREEVEGLKRENLVLNGKRKESRKKVAAMEVIVHSMFLMEIRHRFDSEFMAPKTLRNRMPN